MEDNENVVTEVTENVEEQATEELVDSASVGTDEAVEQSDTDDKKTYTQEDIDKLVNEKLDTILPKKLERAKAKIQREYTEKYGRAETVLNAGLGTNDLNDAVSKLEDFYKNQGVAIPEAPKYDDHDMQILANAEADEIISSGFDDLVEEVDRLADKGIDNMSAKEKLVFTKLATERQKQEQLKELASIGVKQEAIEDNKFKDFASKLNPNLSIKEKYEMYEKFNPKPKVEPIGSMKGVDNEKHIKEYYTPDEVRKLTEKDLDNPQIMAAVEKSMTKWYNEK